jgi:glutamine synthetase
MATFMSRWSLDWPGQSGHVHLSLQRSDGSPAFHAAECPSQMSETMCHFLGGQQALLPEVLAMVAPTVNSYSRLVPGYWAPTTATWGIENRTCALRVVPGSPASQRVEYRIAGADANPYLVVAAALGSGLWGMEHEMRPSEPTAGNAYEVGDGSPVPLPSTLWDAAQRLKHSAAAAELFGDDFVRHFVASREWEEREFRRNVTSWELERYFEVI